MALRLLLGLLKGAAIGGGLGYGAYRLGLDGGWGWVTYGLICFIVGLFVGRPIWSHLLDKRSTVVTAVLKGVFGFGVGVGLYAIVHKLAGDPSFAIAGETHTLTDWTYLFGAAVGALYGAWVEADDVPSAGAKADGESATPGKKK